MDASLPHVPAWVYVVFGVVFVLVVARSLRGSSLRIDRLWIMPVSIVVLTAIALSQRLSHSLPMYALYGSACCAGAALGWWRGQFTLVTVDPETHRLTSHTSPWGMIILLAVLAVRMAFRVWMLEHAEMVHLTANEVTDAFLLFAVGLVVAERVELAIRATTALNRVKAETLRAKIAPVRPVRSRRG